MANEKLSSVIDSFDYNPIVMWAFGIAILALVYSFNKTAGYLLAWLTLLILLIERI